MSPIAYISIKHNGIRAIGLTGWRAKLVQGALAMVLLAVLYEAAVPIALFVGGVIVLVAAGMSVMFIFTLLFGARRGSAVTLLFGARRRTASELATDGSDTNRTASRSEQPPSLRKK